MWEISTRIASTKNTREYSMRWSRAWSYPMWRIVRHPILANPGAANSRTLGHLTRFRLWALDFCVQYYGG